MSSRVTVVLACLAAADATVSVTKCQTGVADLIGETKAFTVQVCNLFGATCYVNHVQTASSDCATKALKVENKQCALFPILSYADHDRADPAKQQVGGPGCSVSCSPFCKFSGACVSVQCSLGGDPATYAGPAMTKTGSSGSRAVGVTDTSAANAFEVNTFASIDDVFGSRTVLLTRTGNYVGTYARGGSSSGTNTYNFGQLPTISERNAETNYGGNYGPEACPSSTTLASAATATKEMLRMCGVIGDRVFFGAANFLMDKGSIWAKYKTVSADGCSTQEMIINPWHEGIAFLSGASFSTSPPFLWKIDDYRVVQLHDGLQDWKPDSANMLMKSLTITPAKSSGMPTQDFAGQWRFYTVVFYCDKYDRTDLTACPAENRKMFYVADPNPAPAFGTTAVAMAKGRTDQAEEPNQCGSGTSGGPSVGYPMVFTTSIAFMLSIAW